MEYNRRKFISFIGKAGVGLAVAPQFLVSCGNTTTPAKGINVMSDDKV
ncbi:hypothetical protein OEG92_09060 [Polaribacter sejongensis]